MFLGYACLRTRPPPRTPKPKDIRVRSILLTFAIANDEGGQLSTIQSHLETGDMRELRGIVLDIEARITRFDQLKEL